MGRGQHNQASVSESLRSRPQDEVSEERDFLLEMTRRAASPQSGMPRLVQEMIVASLSNQEPKLYPSAKYQLDNCEKAYQDAPPAVQKKLLPVLEKFRARVNEIEADAEQLKKLRLRPIELSKEQEFIKPDASVNIEITKEEVAYLLDTNDEYISAAESDRLEDLEGESVKAKVKEVGRSWKGEVAVWVDLEIEDVNRSDDLLVDVMVPLEQVKKAS
jgi:hypothetical protein